MTARWVVDEIQPARDLNITWQPISLFLKNEPEEDSPYYEPTNKTFKMLRVMESVRATEGEKAVGAASRMSEPEDEVTAPLVVVPGLRRFAPERKHV